MSNTTLNRNLNASLRIALFSHPRTNSNLLGKLLSGQPSIAQHMYPFMPQFMWGPDRWLSYDSPESREVQFALQPHFADISAQKALDDLQSRFEATEAQGKIPATKEHPLVDHKIDVPSATASTDSPTKRANPTYVPDHFMHTLTPIFVIRHPARMLPSWYNTSRQFGATTKDMEWPRTTMYHWSRILFDYYCEHFAAAHPPPSTRAKLPLVIDGDDIVQYIMAQLCDLLPDLDPGKVQYTWDTIDPLEAWFVPEDQMSPQVKKFVDAFAGTLA